MTENYLFYFSVQLSNSFNVYVLDRKGHIAELNEPIHVNENQIPKSMRDRFEKQLAEFLISKKPQHSNRKSVFKTNKVSKLDSFKPNSSLVVYSNGRYILDLDNSNFKEGANDSLVNDCEYLDSHECFQENYENIDDPQETIGKTAKESSNKTDSFRKNIEILNADQVTSSSDYVVIFRHGKFFKRFKIVNNDSKKKREEWSSDSDSSESSEESVRKKKYYKSSDEARSTISSKEVHVSLSKEKKESSPEIYPEEDEDEVYLQGNKLVPLKSKNNDDKTKISRRENVDGRRRLPHFLPKRYHWNSDEIKHLGYFWFNGPRGRYPETVAL